MKKPTEKQRRTLDKMISRVSTRDILFLKQKLKAGRKVRRISFEVTESEKIDVDEMLENLGQTARTYFMALHYMATGAFKEFG